MMSGKEQGWLMVSKIALLIERAERAEAERDEAQQALQDVSDWDVYVGCGDDMRKRARAALGEDA
jgi:hypothetical protein